ncbi:Apolipoprotein N-acyltransferase / Copper homeostasis protein CutE [Cystobacter fuscus]|uniref:Apolipoprotein N-acyltransferase / Copper homeostasis protein CutE n=1 Tax=Cystobacter fuscus TaxID=43 RepID=A0A250J645_9BACT|nr:nitrilase-related carbon-nitrogen hydrolase [Cystobacter fuscus]ATB39093.1 Apolipoprotein N-acyltransferase / Copper homeostasis protein CutE [Cystobacter fuscus]
MSGEEGSRRSPVFLPWLALVGGAGMSMLLNSRGSLLPGWLMGALLLFFVRQQRPWVGFVGILSVNTLATGLANLEVFPGSVAGNFGMALGGALFLALTFLADRLIVGPRASFAGTFFLPAAMTGLELFSSVGNPFGTWGSLAYSQAGAPVLVQFVSVTGLWGLTFLLAWFASVVNWAFEHRDEGRRVLPGVAVFAGVLGAILVFGALRLAGAGSVGERVPVAGITVAGEVATGREAGLSRLIQGGAFGDEDWRAFAEASGAVNEELLRLSEREAERGAKLILWSEGNAVVLAGQLPALLSRGSALARERGVWLGMAVASFEPSAERMLRNELILVGPEGNVAWRYVKARPVPGWEAAHSIPGSPEVPVLRDSGVGNLGGAICFDGDFPADFAGPTARGLELLLLPASDWRGISAPHMRQAVFRAVEQGFSLLRQANQGLSVAVDGYGRVYGEMDHFTAEERVLRAELPVGRVPTLYARIGDAVGVLSGLAALGWVAWAVVGGLARRWRARERLHAQPDV